jgi:hypothetical protein
MLARVQHQQQPPPGERLRNAPRRSLAAKLQPDRGGDRGRNQARIGNGRKFGQPHTIGKSRQEPARRGESEPRLADAAGAGQGDEPMRGGKAQDFVKNGIPANQLGNRLRQVRRRQLPGEPPVGTGFVGIGLRGCYCRAGIGLRVSGYGADFAGELVTASGHGADQIAVRAEGRAQCRNLPLEIIFLDDPIGPHARHQRILGNHCSVRLDQRHQHVERATAELDRPAIGEQLAVMRQQEETPERDARRCFGRGIHRPPL